MVSRLFRLGYFCFVMHPEAGLDLGKVIMETETKTSMCPSKGASSPEKENESKVPHVTGFEVFA